MTDLSELDQLDWTAFWRVMPRDLDPLETREWIDALEGVIETQGRGRATFLLRKLLDHARDRRVPMPPVLNSPYRNTISLADQPQYPGNLELEQRVSGLVRWNALATVVRA
ncbi:MAG: pyruvate dehydrogenase (acetyl-transferring), homodimeric type, partial [Burkholderiales bacterium]|nr:pyruvate dehydrogenase (acetyl-transferring), homodimeric type [Burkholderiales bacterium]